MKSRLAFAMLAACLLPLHLRAQDKQPAGEKYALLVGVTRYVSKDLRPLPYSERDVTDLAKVLRDSGYKADNVVVMTPAAGRDDPRFLPLADRVRAELALLLKNRKPGDTVVVAFAGHGLHFKEDAASYFCPADADPLAKKNLLPLAEVYRQLEGCKAGLKLLLVDACRNDPFQDKSRARSEFDGDSATRPKLAEPPGGVVAFFSCSEAEKAYEHDDLKHGVFFHYVIEALKGEAAGDGEVVTLPALSDYVSRHVADFVRAKYGQAQTPELSGKLRGVFPLVRLDRLGVAVRRAMECVERGDADRALAEADAALRRNPRSAPAYAARGEAYRVMGHLDKALEDYAQALRLDPGCMEAYRGRGWTHGFRTKWGQADADLREALRLLRPGTAEAYVDRCVVYLGLGLLAKSNYDRALADADEAIRLDPRLAKAHIARATALEGKKLYTKALASANEALRLDPTHAGAYLIRGRVYCMQSDYDKGIDDLTEVLRRAPKVSFVYSTRGLARAAKKDFDKALADCNEAIRLSPALSTGYAARAVVHNLMQSYDKALTDCNESIRLAPSAPETYAARAIAHAGKAMFQQTVADLSEAIRIDSKNPEYYTARAQVYIALGDTTKAQADVDMARKLLEEMK